MTFFDKTRYIRALIVLLPLGIILLFLGIKYIINNPSNLDKLPKQEGIINDIKNDQIYFENCKCNLDEVTIHFENNKYRTREKDKIKVLTKSILVGDKIVIGYDKENYIQYLKKGNDTLIKYERSLVYSYMFIVLGFLLSSLSLYYILTHWKDLF